MVPAWLHNQTQQTYTISGFANVGVLFSLDWIQLQACKKHIGGDSAYERGGDARRKFWIKPPKWDRSGRGPSFFWPLKETMLKRREMRKLGLYEWSK